MMKSKNSSAFTLIELLVVIAIIALLVGILLPSLNKARSAARLGVSLSNVRQINVANQGYRNDFKDTIPSPFYTSTSGQTGICIWAYGGKYASARWAPLTYADVPPGARQLNSYVYPNNVLDRVVNAAARETIQLAAFKSPGDRATYYDPAATGNSVNGDPRRTGYDDIGTSYPMNIYFWRTAFAPGAGNSLAANQEAFRWGVRKLNSGTTDSSKLVLFADQTSYAVISDDDPIPNKRLGEFGDVNRSVMGFLDGHADYIPLERRPNTVLNPYMAFAMGGMLSSSGNNAPFKYSFVLERRVR